MAEETKDVGATASSIMKSLKPGDNPREVLSNHRERGPKEFVYTYEDIANITGLAVSTVQTYANKGQFQVEDLQSVSEFITKRLAPPPPPFDMDAERRDLEKITGVGLTWLGRRKGDGRGVFSLQHLNGLAFRQARLKAEQLLVAEGYVPSRWDTDDDKEQLEGWAFVKKPEQPEKPIRIIP